MSVCEFEWKIIDSCLLLLLLCKNYLLKNVVFFGETLINGQLWQTKGCPQFHSLTLLYTGSEMSRYTRGGAFWGQLVV